jgi:hypothetical protein
VKGKNPMTPSGIEPATFQIVAQNLNHCATAVPYIYVLVHVIMSVNQGLFDNM